MLVWYEIEGRRAERFFGSLIAKVRHPEIKPMLICFSGHGPLLKKWNSFE